MLPLETKQSGGKLLPHSDLRGGVFPEEVSRSCKRNKDAQNRDGWPVTCGYGEELSGSINAGNFLTSCKVYWLASQEGLCSME